MAMQSRETGEFSLIVVEADAGRIGESVEAFAKAFALDESLAGQVLLSAPILFASGLTKSEVKAVTPKLMELSNLGIEFRVTARTVGKMPKVHWPSQPMLMEGGAGGLAFEWQNTVFACPSCGEGFIFKRLGKLNLASEGPVAPAADVPAVAEVLASEPAAEEAPPAEEPAPPPEEMAAPVYAEQPAEGAQPAEGEQPAEEQPAETVEPQPEGEAVEVPAEVDAAIEEAVFAPSEEEPPVEEAAPPPSPPAPVARPMPMRRVVPATVPVGAAPRMAPPVPVRPPAPVAAPQHAAAAPAGAPAPAPAAAGAPAGASGEVFNVFLSKITDKVRQTQAAEVISKIRGCPLEEAKGLTTRLVIPIAKGVTKQEAEGILGEFKKIKVFGRMTPTK